MIELQTIPAPSAAADRAAPRKPSNARKLRLLLVEDHDSTRDVLARILGRAGHEVQVAGNGAQAIAIARTEPRFDAVISDIGLPDQSGFDLMRVLKAEHQLPGIAFSGYGMEEDVRKAKAAGFGAHLVKPISFDHLSALLDQVASGALT
jgi:CheY-like chemotaxis protein